MRSINLNANKQQQQYHRAISPHALSCRRYIRLMGVPDYKSAKILYCLNDKQLCDNRGLLVFSHLGILSIGVTSESGYNSSSAYGVGTPSSQPLLLFSANNKCWPKSSIKDVQVYHHSFTRQIIKLIDTRYQYQFSMPLRYNWLLAPITYLRLIQDKMV